MRTALEGLIRNAAIAAPAAVTDEDKQRLAALGYVGGGSSVALSLPGDSLPDPKDKVKVLERYRQAADLAGALKFDEAVAVYREVLAEDPEMTDVWLQLAEVQVRRGSMPDAIAAYKEVIKRKPEGRRQPDRRRRSAAADRHSSTRRGSTPSSPSVSRPAGAHEMLAKIALARARPRKPRGAKRRWRSRPTARCRCRSTSRGCSSTTRAGTPRRSARSCARREALRGRTVQMNDLNYYIGDSLARLRALPGGGAVPARRSAAVPAQHPRARRAGDALPRDGPQRRIRARHRGDAARVADAGSARRRGAALDDVRRAREGAAGENPLGRREMETGWSLIRSQEIRRKGDQARMADAWSCFGS